MAEQQRGVGTRLYVAGGQEAKRDFAAFGADGKRAFSEIGAAAREANPALLAVSRTVGGVKEDTKAAGTEVAAAARTLGVFGVAAVASAGLAAGFAVAMVQTRAALNFTSEIDATSKRLRVSAEGLQEWRFAAQEAGLQASVFEQAVEGANDALGKAQAGLGGSKEIVSAYGLLGITPAELDAVRSIEELLPMIADGLQRVGSEAERAAIAKRLGVVELLPLLTQGADKIANLRAEAHELGAVIDNEMVKSTADMAREVERAADVIDVNLKQAFLNLAPVLIYLSGLVSGFAQKTNNFLEGFKKFDNRSTQFLIDQRGGYLAEMTKLSMMGTPNDKGNANRMNDLRTKYDTIGLILAERYANDGPSALSGDMVSVPPTVRKPRAARAARDTRTTLGTLIQEDPLTAYDRLTGQKLDPRAIEEAARRDSALGPSFEKAKTMVVDIDPDRSFQALNDRLDRLSEEAGEKLRGGIEDGLRALANGDIWDFLKGKLTDALFAGAADLLAGMFEKGASNGGAGSWIAAGVSAIFGRKAAGGEGEAGKAYSMAEYGGAELAVFGQRGQVFSHDDTVRLLRGVAGGDRGGGVRLGDFTYAPVYSVQGSGPEIDRLRAEMAQDRASFESRVAGAVNDGIERRAIRVAS